MDEIRIETEATPPTGPALEMTTTEIVVQLRRLAGELSEHWPGIRGVSELDERVLRDAVSDIETIFEVLEANS